MCQGQCIRVTLSGDEDIQKITEYDLYCVFQSKLFPPRFINTVELIFGITTVTPIYIKFPGIWYPAHQMSLLNDVETCLLMTTNEGQWCPQPS